MIWCWHKCNLNISQNFFWNLESWPLFWHYLILMGPFLCPTWSYCPPPLTTERIGLSLSHLVPESWSWEWLKGPFRIRNCRRGCVVGVGRGAPSLCQFSWSILYQFTIVSLFPIFNIVFRSFWYLIFPKS